MSRRIWNFVAGGFVIGFVSYFAAGIVTSEPQLWILPVVWIGAGFLISRSARPWSNTWVVMAIVSFALPLFTFAGSALSASQDASVQSSEAAAAGAAIGTLLVGGIGGFFGFFFGIIFVILAAVTRRTREQ